MLALLIVLIAVAVLAVVLTMGAGFGGPQGPGGPVVRRRVIHRRRPPVRRVYTEHEIVDERPPPVDRPSYRR